MEAKGVAAEIACPAAPTSSASLAVSTSTPALAARGTEVRGMEDGIFATLVEERLSVNKKVTVIHQDTSQILNLLHFKIRSESGLTLSLEKGIYVVGFGNL